MSPRAFDWPPFYSDCVGWPRDRLDALEHLVDHGEEITQDTFIRRTGVNPNPKVRAADAGGYRGPGWIRPYGFTYWRLPGLPVYWYVWSAIEHVYATPEAIDAVQEAAAAAVRP